MPETHAVTASWEITILSRRLRDGAGQADLDHLRRIGTLGRACGLLRFATVLFRLTTVRKYGKICTNNPDPRVC